MVAALMLLGMYVRFPAPSGYTPFIHAVIGGWVLYSIAVALWLQYRQTTPTMSVLHVIDILWPGLITLITQGPISPFFAMFMFGLVAAGVRWGFPETMKTAFVIASILGLEALIERSTTNRFHDAFDGEFEINRLVVRCGFVIIIGFLIGTGAENEKVRRAEAAVVNRVLHAVRPEAGLASSLQLVLSEFLRLFSAKSAYLVVQEVRTTRALVWYLDADTSDGKPRMHEAAPEELEGYLLRQLPRSFCCRTLKTGVQMAVLEGGVLQTRELTEMPSAKFTEGPVKSMISAASDMGDEWFARLTLIDARLGNDRRQEMVFAEGLARQATAALYSVFLIRRLRSRAGAMQRARVARELHDGAIQSLISAEMRVDVLRRRAERGCSNFAGDLGEVQQLLRNEVLNLRELMQQMRPVDLTPEQLLDYVADAVDRFRRDTGIEAKFLSDLQEVHLTPHSCRELVRIVQEGLVNIRKHAHATHALVRIMCNGGALRLTISDNGRGFDFEGLIGSEELSATSKGPMIIKERVRAIGGQLSIESMPGRGSRLEITLPPKGKSAHG